MLLPGCTPHWEPHTTLCLRRGSKSIGLHPPAHLYPSGIGLQLTRQGREASITQECTCSCQGAAIREGHTQPTQETPLKHLCLGTRVRELHYWARQDITYVKATLSEPGVVDELPNTQKHRVRHNEETEEYVPNKRITQNIRKRTKQNGNKQFIQ